MANNLPDPSSDLRTARAISARLTGTATAAQPKASAGERGGYARFSIGVRPAPVTPVPTPSRERLLVPPESAWTGAFGGSGGWPAVLEWCAGAVGGDAALAMDPQGLVVACTGGFSAEQAQGIGARLMLAFDQANAMAEGGSSEMLNISLGVQYLTGLRIAIADMGALTIGIRAPRALGEDELAQLSIVLTKKASGG